MDQNETKELDKAKLLLGTMKQLAALIKGTELGKSPVRMSDFVDFVTDTLDLLTEAGGEISSLRARVTTLENAKEIPQTYQPKHRFE